MVGHRRAAGREHPPRVGVVPVVDDAREQVGVGARRHGGEEVARARTDSDRRARPPSRRRSASSPPPGGRRGRRAAPAPRAGPPRAGRRSRRRRRRARAARRSRRPRRRPRPRAARGRPSRPGRRPRAPGAAARCSKKRSPWTCSNAVPPSDRRAQQPGGRRPVQLAAHEDRSAQRARDAVAQALADRGEREAAVAVLREHVLEHEAAQHARERVGVGAHRLGDLATRPRAVGEDVGHAELRRDVEQLGRQVAVDQAREIALRRGRCGGPVRRRTCVHSPIDPRLLRPVNRATRTRGGRARCPALWSQHDRGPGRPADFGYGTMSIGTAGLRTSPRARCPSSRPRRGCRTGRCSARRHRHRLRLSWPGLYSSLSKPERGG